MTLQDVLAEYGQDFLNTHNLSPHARKVFSAILNCRTAVLGAHRLVCDNCGHEIFMNNSCRDRHCPICQTAVKNFGSLSKANICLTPITFTRYSPCRPNLIRLFSKIKKKFILSSLKPSRKPSWIYAETINIWPLYPV